MFRKPSFAVAVVSAILIIYCALINFEISFPFIYFIFGVSPFLLIWVAYTIIRYGKYDGKELAEDEEWGYQDKDKDELGVF